MSEEKPLAGVRVSIKDNYDLKGIRTTMMNRAYNELYPPRTSSADYVTKLTQLGAVIVGKTKMSAFASAEEPTDQWVDYHCPFNPRGDTYQTPSCSSTGAGASLAGYTWLDHSIGSDSESFHRPSTAILLTFAKHPAVYVFQQPSTAFSASGPRTVLPPDKASSRAASKYTQSMHGIVLDLMLWKVSSTQSERCTEA